MYAVSGPVKLSTWVSSSDSKPTARAVDLSTSAEIREDPGSAAAGSKTTAVACFRAWSHLPLVHVYVVHGLFSYLLKPEMQQEFVASLVLVGVDG